MLHIFKKNSGRDPRIRPDTKSRSIDDDGKAKCRICTSLPPEKAGTESGMRCMPLRKLRSYKIARVTFMRMLQIEGDSVYPCAIRTKISKSMIIYNGDDDDEDVDDDDDDDDVVEDDDDDDDDDGCNKK
ncbi:hypothetical protein PoB_007501400 [Plakobranchus ocellatus]|uniref:Uncharacterized protein n=1 Tax=Plakobranchus ocellatus TaxID=259542 RepID=A0AAV4DWR3_9GAST|nr:hypothetical protein PoB_007501400 [Plakobranchus ocellatus]